MPAKDFGVFIFAFRHELVQIFVEGQRIDDLFGRLFDCQNLRGNLRLQAFYNMGFAQLFYYLTLELLQLPSYLLILFLRLFKRALVVLFLLVYE